MLKHSAHDGCAPHDTAPVAVAQETRLRVASPLAKHPTDPHEAPPTLDALAPAGGTPDAVAMAHGSCRAATLPAWAQRGLAPDMATGRAPPHKTWRLCCAEPPEPPPADARLQVQRASKRQPASGHALDRLRTCPVEPVLGLIKAVGGGRQLSGRGLTAAAGAGGLGCVAVHRKRWHMLLAASAAALPA
jgi:hypothetical protein